METKDESSKTQSLVKEPAIPTYVTHGETVARVVDPMVRVFEKLLKIKEREERGKYEDTKKEKEKESAEELVESADMISQRSSTKKTIEGKSKIYKLRYLMDVTQPKPKSEEEIPFSFVKKELEKRTKEEMKEIWFKYVGKYLIDDSIERDWKELIGEIQLDGEESQESVQQISSKAKPKDNSRFKGRLSVMARATMKDHKPLTRKEFVDLHKAQRILMDMKYVDMFKKEPVKSAYYHNLIRNLQSRNTSRHPRTLTKSQRRKQPMTSEKEHVEIKRKVDIEPDPFVENDSPHESEAERSLDEERLGEDESLLLHELEYESLTEIKSIESEVDWASCHSIAKSLGEATAIEDGDEEEGEMGKISYIRSVIVGQNTIRDEMELIEEDIMVENIWKNLEEFEAKDSDDSLQFLYLDEKRHKESVQSNNLKELDTYTEFKRKQKKKAEKEKREAAFQEKLQKRIEKLAKLKDPAYWHQLMEDSMQRELELVEEEESEIYDEEFEEYLEYLEQEDEVLLGEDEEFKVMKVEEKESKQEINKEQQGVAEEEELVLLEGEEQEEQDLLLPFGEESMAKWNETFEEGDMEISNLEELSDEGDVRKLSDTKTYSTASEENLLEEEYVKVDQRVSVHQSNPKARYFNPAYPELFASDVSIFPSYTDLKRPYILVCSDRIKGRLSSYKKLFRNELLSLQRRHPFAFGGVQLARQFIIGIRVPRRFVDPMKFKEREKVENLLAGRTI